MNVKPFRTYILALLLFASGVAAGFFADRFSGENGGGHAAHRHTHMSGFRYTNPLLDCEIMEEAQAGELKPFKFKVKQLIEAMQASGRVAMVSVYFRDLDNGTSFGINSREKFSPASLMKVPVMMGYLKKAETDPAVLKQVMVYDGREDWNARQNLKPPEAILPGKGYTVDELIYRMMAYSDNNAWSVLFRNIGPEYLDQILADVHVDYDPERSEDLMTVKSYASLYRVLYNSTYLSRKMSERALGYMVHPDFKDGILAGIPVGVPFASKFGERSLDDRSQTKQLHEFGIVYYKGHPYLLGIMTRGKDFNVLATVLRDISQLVYAEVDSHMQRGGRH